jgi:alpha/beta superfamily hydrolase
VRRGRRHRVRLQTADGLSLEAEWNAPEVGRATAVLCHPHPQYGGTMRSIVISALYEALPGQGVACLRFNFRGVEGSEGAYSEGRDEPLDILAAIDAAEQGAAEAGIAGPLALIGWSFGADMALGIDDPRITGWVGIAPPLRFRPEAAYRVVGDDARPKLLLLASNDEYRAPDEIATVTRDWTATRIEVISGASHFFVGRTDRVVAHTGDFVGDLTAGGTVNS